MLVKELIAALQKQDPDATILVKGKHIAQETGRYSAVKVIDTSIGSSSPFDEKVDTNYVVLRTDLSLNNLQL